MRKKSFKKIVGICSIILIILTCVNGTKAAPNSVWFDNPFPKFFNYGQHVAEDDLELNSLQIEYPRIYSIEESDWTLSAKIVSSETDINVSFTMDSYLMNGGWAGVSKSPVTLENNGDSKVLVNAKTVEDNTPFSFQSILKISYDANLHDLVGPHEYLILWELVTDAGEVYQTQDTVTLSLTYEDYIQGNVTTNFVDVDNNVIADPVIKEYETGQYYTTEAKKIDGYTYKDVHEDSDLTKGYFLYNPINVTYVYEAIPEKYTVKFDSNGGNTISDQTYLDYNDLVDEPDKPTKKGYTFEGWYVDNNTFKTLWHFNSDKVTKNTTLYAKWKAVSTAPTPDEPSTPTLQRVPKAGDETLLVSIVLSIIGGSLIMRRKLS